MPKKNGFVMYLDSRRESLLEQGHKLDEGYQQLIELCTNGWEKLSHAEKKRFAEEAKAFNEKQIMNSRGALAVGDKLRRVDI